MCLSALNSYNICSSFSSLQNFVSLPSPTSLLILQNPQTIPLTSVFHLESHQHSTINHVMTTIRVAPQRAILSRSGPAYISKAIASSLNGSSTTATTGLRCSYHLFRPYNSPFGKRKFSSTTKQQLEVFPPPSDAPSIRVTYVDPRYLS
jgi:hypothetical protein